MPLPPSLGESLPGHKGLSSHLQNEDAPWIRNNIYKLPGVGGHSNVCKEERVIALTHPTSPVSMENRGGPELSCMQVMISNP